MTDKIVERACYITVNNGYVLEIILRGDEAMGVKRVLIVDDAIVIRNRLNDLIMQCGHQVVGQAGDGWEAMDKIRRLTPDVVTLDLTMPFMSGLEVLEDVKRLNPQVKVIVVASNGSEHAVREAVLKGADYFIMKPFEDSDVKRLFGSMKD